jgi:hypothetical protein
MNIEDNRDLDGLRISLSCDLADLILRERYGIHIEFAHDIMSYIYDDSFPNKFGRIYVIDKDGGRSYTEEAQDQFNSIYDIVENNICQSLNVYEIKEKK